LRSSASAWNFSICSAMLVSSLQHSTAVSGTAHQQYESAQSTSLSAAQCSCPACRAHHKVQQHKQAECDTAERQQQGVQVAIRSAMLVSNLQSAHSTSVSSSLFPEHVWQLRAWPLVLKHIRTASSLYFPTAHLLTYAFCHKQLQQWHAHSGVTAQRTTHRNNFFTHLLLISAFMLKQLTTSLHSACSSRRWNSGGSRQAS
jgi:hypothetical protein